METPPNETPTKVQKFLSGFNQALPVVGLIYAVFLTVAGYWLYARDAQTVQAQSIKELQSGQKSIEKLMEDRTAARDRQLSEMQKIILTRELYEAYHKADIERMDRIEKLLEKLLYK